MSPSWLFGHEKQLLAGKPEQAQNYQREAKARESL